MDNYVRQIRFAVAPLAGAWIEILAPKPCTNYKLVAPLAGAWIEIILFYHQRVLYLVAPLAGAWIEMVCVSIMFKRPVESLPSRERGLKYPISCTMF